MHNDLFAETGADAFCIEDEDVAQALFVIVVDLIFIPLDAGVERARPAQAEQAGDLFDGAHPGFNNTCWK